MRRIDGWSLQRRLLGGLCCILVLIAVGLYFMLAGYAERAADRAFDQLLLASALTIADALQFEDGRDHGRPALCRRWRSWPPAAATGSSTA